MPIAALLLALALSQSAAADPDWSKFPVFLWSDQPRAGRIARELGGVCVQRLDEAGDLREAGLDYFVFNAPGRNDLHLDRESRGYQKRWQAWYDTRDDALLVREPCTSDPATRERLFRLLDESLAARGGRHGFGVSLGDEVGLTPGGSPEDVCVCARCAESWKRWYSEHLRGEAPPIASISTDAVRLALCDDANEPLGNWLARRRFHQDQWIDLLRQLATRARTRSPGTPVGLLGIAGQSAFGGVAVERVLPLVDFLECYDVGNARELAFTLRESRQRMLATVFCDPRGPDFTAWHAWEHWIRGGDGLVAWSERDLEKSPAHRARLLRAIADIRAVQAMVGRFRPEPVGVAIVHSHVALAASWMRDALLDGATWPRRFQSYQEEHGRLEQLRNGWFDLAEDVGAMPGAWPLERVGAETAKRFHVLVLVRQLVLDDADLARLDAFVAAGGRVLVAGPELSMPGECGWFDSRGHRRTLEPERPWMPRSSSGAGLPGYISFAGGRDAMQEWFQRNGVEFERAPWSVGGEPGNGWCWISTWMREASGFLCATLPKPGLDAGVNVVLPETVEIAPDEGLRVEWLHPLPDQHGTVRLPRGDAAVFRLVRAK